MRLPATARDPFIASEPLDVALGPDPPLSWWTSMDTRPDFLDLLDVNPERATALLRLYIAAAAQKGIPRGIQTVSESDREDWVQSFLIHLYGDSFRRLRTYQDLGYRFSTWYYQVSRRHFTDFRKSRGYRPIPGLDDPEAEQEVVGRVSNRDADVSDRVHFRDVLDKVRAAMEHLEQECRIMLGARAQEMKPEEIKALLPDLPESPTIYERLRKCMRRLCAVLETMGVDVRALTSELRSENL
jgi:DNA-directed RNA polymerase specialized sigma24 family protein